MAVTSQNGNRKPVCRSHRRDHRSILTKVLRRNILIFHQAALGDFIVTWPLAMALSRIFPQSRIMYVTHSQKGALAERVLRVESFDAEAGWHVLHQPGPEVPKLPERSARLLAGANLIISFTAGGIDTLTHGLAQVCPESKIISLDTRYDTGGHVSESLLKQLTELPILAEAMQQLLRSVASRGVGISLAPQDRIVIHPGAGKEANRWPAERYLELVRKCRDGGKRVRVLLGETETERWSSALVGQFESVAEVRRPTTLLELLDELSSTSIFIGNDSGPGHLAGIIGVPTVSLFGGSDPVRWRPLGPKVSIIQANSMAEISVDQVYTHVGG
ncbi:MAG TPA: glycosyltransferase family 9 protein [Tepidisphaeraceae bacterium]|nr:glycosyltransferase family 9 protein [Tepidisphaeraceae bacterium]